MPKKKFRFSNRKTLMKNKVMRENKQFARIADIGETAKELVFSNHLVQGERMDTDDSRDLDITPNVMGRGQPELGSPSGCGSRSKAPESDMASGGKDISQQLLRTFNFIMIVRLYLTQ